MYTEIKNYEDVCKALGIDTNALPDVSALPEKDQQPVIAQYKLTKVAEALNEGWQPDWSNHRQWKYYPWLDVVKDESKPSGFGLSSYVCGYTIASTYVGSRLVFATSDVAKHAFTHFKDLYETYFLINK